MADETPIGSQEAAPSSRGISPYGENTCSSPILPVSGQQHGSKQRKPPTVTPRSFTRFFTPKSSLERGGRIGASRQVLRDITASASNRKGWRTSTKDTIQFKEVGFRHSKDILKKRKRQKSTSPDTTPDRSSPLKRIRNQSLEIAEDDETDTGTLGSWEELDETSYREGDSQLRRKNLVDPVVGSKYRGGLGRNLQRELGIRTNILGYRPLEHSSRGLVAEVVAGSQGSLPMNIGQESCNRLSSGASKDWQYETTSFYTRPEDAYVCANVAAPSEHTIPFCIISCNTNSLVAVGDEDGGVRLLESARDDKRGFSKAYLAFRPHANAILDLAFSPDDLLLATASGDQTSQIIDMPTQRATYSLAGHLSSVKQVCFQPGSSNVVASSSRDGSVQIWDLRCKGFDPPVRDIRVSLEPSGGDTGRTLANAKMTWARSVNTISDAHACRQPVVSTATAGSKPPQPSFDAPSKTESPGRRGDVSITALSFLQPGREHLLVTGSEANASIKLWDLRTTHNHRRSRATPLSSTQQPDSHNKHRHFGLTSLSLSGNGRRLYALCRDNTVYAYSTSHLILGHAPELSKSLSKPRRSGGPEKEGLGPIYGFRHPKFHAATFYVKSALRSAADDKGELLAVGSSDGCAVIFPTDERYMQRTQYQQTQVLNSPFRRSRPTLSRTDSGIGLSTRLEDNVPIYQHGSALIRGHSREVTGLAWTPEGELVTVGDDFAARSWREGAEARDLRVGGEREGRRWGCGWAEAEEGWDEDNG
ncbi:hypothetical protein MMC28_004243 [Mycoblastus sanguinarius]|nr:hypothetical protein [Mycoblastus sanguinarius]